MLDKGVEDEHLLDTENDFESVNKYKKYKGNPPKMKKSAQDVDTEKSGEGCRLAAHCLEDEKNNILFDSSAVLEERFDPRENKPDLDLSNIKMPPKILKRGRPKGTELTVIGLPKLKRRKANSSNLHFQN